jgi:hypothetical protein
VPVGAFETATWQTFLGGGTSAGAAAGTLAGSGPAWVSDTEAAGATDVRLRAAAAAGLHCAAVAPLQGPEGPLGVVECLSREPREPDAAALDAIAAAGTLLGHLGHALGSTDRRRVSGYTRRQGVRS